MNIFRKVRKELAAENKAAKYTRYAIGEIALIIFGILIALQIQNWNENRKQDARFKDIMNKIYTALKDDLSNIDRTMDFARFSIQNCDFILSESDTIPTVNKIHAIFNSYNGETDAFSTDVEFYASYFNNQFKKEGQSSIAMQVLGYLKASENTWKENSTFKSGALMKYVVDQGIPYPMVNEKKVNEGFDIFDNNFYSEEQLQHFEQIIREYRFRASLFAYRTIMIYKAQGLFSLQSEVKSLMAKIKNHYPDVRILFQNVGIIGTSLDGFDNVGAHSTPMIETQPEKSIWETTLHLKKGRVKFRCNDSWTQNWGAPFYDVPNVLQSEAIKDGADIPIEAEGSYHITLNLTDFTYSFEKLSN